MKKPLLALTAAVLTVSCVDPAKPKNDATTSATPIEDAAPAGTVGPTETEICGGAGGDSGIDAIGCPGLDEPVDTTALALTMGFGANIGNTLENTAVWETGWGQPLITQTFINGMASRGIKTVRVPVAWDTYARDGMIDASKMSRVREVVEWILAADMFAIVNIHWDNGWIDNEKNTNKYRLTDDVKAKFAGYWEQIGAAFGDVGHRLIFEALNEEGVFYLNGTPNGTPDMAALNQLNQLFVSTVRSQAGYNFTRPLLIAGFGTNIDKTCVDAFAVPTDPAGVGRLFLSVHYYDPSTFTILEKNESWGSPAATWGTDREKLALENQFTKLTSFSSQKQIPVILGEFGVTVGQKVRRDSASRVLWMTSVIKACFARGMVPVLWDCGTDISRTDGSFSNDLQAVMNNLP
jgi:endoglucanase